LGRKEDKEGEKRGEKRGVKSGKERKREGKREGQRGAKKGKEGKKGEKRAKEGKRGQKRGCHASCIFRPYLWLSCVSASSSQSCVVVPMCSNASREKQRHNNTRLRAGSADAGQPKVRAEDARCMTSPLLPPFALFCPLFPLFPLFSLLCSSLPLSFPLSFPLFSTLYPPLFPSLFPLFILFSPQMADDADTQKIDKSQNNKEKKKIKKKEEISYCL
jgi:hypothetical protein